VGTKQIQETIGSRFIYYEMDVLQWILLTIEREYLCYTHQMMKTPLTGLAWVLGDNQRVIPLASISQTNLNEHYSTIC
jgi:hypothetical protein